MWHSYNAASVDISYHANNVSCGIIVSLESQHFEPTEILQFNQPLN